MKLTEAIDALDALELPIMMPNESPPYRRRTGHLFDPDEGLYADGGSANQRRGTRSP